MPTIRLYSRKELAQTRRDWSDVIPHVRDQIDVRMATVPDLACKRQCAHCCKLKVHALPHEVMEVVEYIRFSDNFSRTARATILDRLRYAVEKTDGMDENAYRAADVSCPFLSDNNLCLVYPVRPLACRAFGSTNVSVCDLSVPDDGSTFKIVPNSLLKLLGTSGLFFTDFLKSCLGWWQGFGVESQVSPEELANIEAMQKFLDEGGNLEVRNG